MSCNIRDVHESHQILIDRLQAMQTTGGYWTGELSKSALSTATAISALAVCLSARRNRSEDFKPVADHEQPECWQTLIEQGSEYLYKSQNADGGFGDTDRSHSNIATTLLVIAAWRLVGKYDLLENRIRDAEAYVDRNGKWEGLRRRYGKDKTFVVPILSNCALAGMVPWTEVSPLPFEAAALPQAWYRFAQIPVVSYAIPALVAIGQARFVHAPPGNPVVWLLRRSILNRTRNVLRKMQPNSGGYLEATPLTSFVLMNIASIGLVDSDVSVACRKFIVESVLDDGSWPIDTNLATWVTSLAIHALMTNQSQTEEHLKGSQGSNPSPPAPLPEVGSRGGEGRGIESLSEESTERSGDGIGSVDKHPEQEERIRTDFTSLVRTETIDWLLSCQHRVRHPFTGAEPGGWGWTNLSGAVPDSDDTPAALLALHAWYCQQPIEAAPTTFITAVELGIEWLLKLQNRDGGWPTFCRGWGKLPFDRSGADLTAHAIRALAKWSKTAVLSKQVGSKRFRVRLRAIEDAIRLGLKFLRKKQHPDGSWLPLWFGNQDRLDEENPIYGTGRVLLALGDLTWERHRSTCLQSVDIEGALRGIDYLLSQQNADGGWGGGISVRYLENSNEPESRADQGALLSTIEETSVALEGLSACGTLLDQHRTTSSDGPLNRLSKFDQAIDRAVACLATKIKNGDCVTSQPIGFYFAKLWYHERMYPYVFAAAALNRVRLLKTFGQEL